MKIPRRLLHLRGVRIYQSLISIKRENMAAGLSLHSSMYIYMTFSNLKNKLACSQFKFTYLIIYISPSKLKPKLHGLASLFFLPKENCPLEYMIWCFFINKTAYFA